MTHKEENFKVFINKLIEFLSENEKIKWNINIFNEGSLEIDIEEVTDRKLKDILATSLYEIPVEPVENVFFSVNGFENIVKNIDLPKDKWYSLNDEEKNLIHIKTTAFIQVFPIWKEINWDNIFKNAKNIS